MAAPILWVPGILCLCLQENLNAHSCFRWGVFPGENANSIFMGAGGLPGEKWAPRNHAEISSPISSADFSMTPIEGTEQHFGPF